MPRRCRACRGMDQIPTPFAYKHSLCHWTFASFYLNLGVPLCHWTFASFYLNLGVPWNRTISNMPRRCRACRGMDQIPTPFAYKHSLCHWTFASFYLNLGVPLCHWTFASFYLNLGVPWNIVPCIYHVYINEIRLSYPCVSEMNSSISDFEHVRCCKKRFQLKYELNYI